MTNFLGLHTSLSPSLASLLLFGAWTLLMVTITVSIRTLEVLTGPLGFWQCRLYSRRCCAAGKKKANDYQVLTGFQFRLNRVHLNCVENLPVYAVSFQLLHLLPACGIDCFVCR